jgi:hypothetical protein
MAHLNVTVMTDDHQIETMIFEIDKQAGAELFALATRAEGLMPTEALANIGGVLAGIATVRIVTAAEALGMMKAQPEPIPEAPIAPAKARHRR